LGQYFHLDDRDHGVIDQLREDHTHGSGSPFSWRRSGSWEPSWSTHGTCRAPQSRTWQANSTSPIPLAWSATWIGQPRTASTPRISAVAGLPRLQRPARAFSLGALATRTSLAEQRATKRPVRPGHRPPGRTQGALAWCHHTGAAGRQYPRPGH
jgi:hypothetical protein